MSVRAIFGILKIFMLLQVLKGKLICDQRLLSTFQLRGLKTAVRDKMKICPMVQERCCTLMDQIAILKLWNNHGQTSTRLYSDAFYQSMNSLFKYVNYLNTDLKEEDITIHYAKHKWIPYLKNYCFYQYLPRVSTKEIEEAWLKEIIPGAGKIDEFNKQDV